MGRNVQEDMVEFRKETSSNEPYPEIRGIVVYTYGGTIEESIEKARKQLNLGYEWKVIKTETE